MIEDSDNDAATYLWNDVGHTRLNQFVKAATMTETELNSGGGVPAGAPSGLTFYVKGPRA